MQALSEWNAKQTQIRRRQGEMRTANRGNWRITADTDIMKRLFVGIVLFMPGVQPVGLNDNEGCTFVNIVPLRSFLPIQCKDRLVGSSWEIIVCFRTNRPTRKVHSHTGLSRQGWIDYSPCYVSRKIGQWEKTFALCHD